MSRPGFPISGSTYQSGSNSYTTWQGQTFNGTDNSLHRQRFEDKQGNNTPGFPAVKFVNSYLRSNFSWEQEMMDVQGTIDQGFGRFDHSSGQFGDSYGVGVYPWDSYWSLDSELSDVRNKLIYKLINRIQSSRVNLGEIYHTKAQTASMVTSTINRFIGTVQSLRHGNFVGAARYLTGADPRTRSRIRTSRSGRVTSGLGGLPEQWLALKYGWQPALQDVYNSCETVRRAWNDLGEVFHVDVSATVEAPYKERIRSPNVPWGPRFRVYTGSRQVSGKASIHYRVDSAIGSSLSQLGITNPASLAWELLPYSFVVDWFFPVGQFLESLDYSRGLAFSFGWMSFKMRQNLVQEVMDKHVSYGNISSDFSRGGGSGSGFVMSREPLLSFPAPPLPHLKDPFSPTHFANGLSLLATAFRGGKIPR